MYIPIIYPSAAEFWQKPENLKFTEKMSLKGRSLVRLPDQYTLCYDKNYISQIKERLSLSYPIKLMACSEKERRTNQYINCSTRSEFLPEGSFVNAGKLKLPSYSNDSYCNIVIASPELCLLEAAKTMTFYELVKFGHDLCAIYIQNENEEFLQKRRIPVTTVASIKQYLDQCVHIRGIGLARKAVSYIYDCSNSPMETELSMFASLPYSLGGFGTGNYELNPEIMLSNQGADLLGVKSCRCDLGWKKQLVAVEYDSNLTHLSPGQHDWDKRKASALTLSGYKVISVTARMMSSVEEIENTFISILKLLGKRFDFRKIEATRNKRQELFDFFRNR